MSDIARSPLDQARLQRAAASSGMWRRLDVVTETGSTNADLLARSAAGEDIAGAVLLAEYQSAGRGRHGRTWVAAPRSQITMSVGVDVAGVAPAAWGWIPLLSGVAVVDTVREIHGVSPTLKWPNDVLVGSAKLAGILAEVATPAPVVIVGIGLNVTLTADEAPDSVATSLAMLGVTDIDRSELTARLLANVAARFEHWKSLGGNDAQLATDYTSMSSTLSTEVRVLLPGGREITGVACSIDDSGRLLMNDGDSVVPISAGDITHLRPASGDQRNSARDITTR